MSVNNRQIKWPLHWSRTASTYRFALASHTRFQHQHRCQEWQLAPISAITSLQSRFQVRCGEQNAIEPRSMLTMVASVATLKPLPSVVSSVLGALDGGESKNVGLTPGKSSVIGTSDRPGWPPKSLENQLLAPDCTSLRAGTAADELVDAWNCLTFEVRGRKPRHHLCADIPADQCATSSRCSADAERGFNAERFVMHKRCPHPTIRIAYSASSTLAQLHAGAFCTLAWHLPFKLCCRNIRCREAPARLG